MALGTTFIIVALLVAAVWLLIEFKRLKHKLFAIFLIGLIIFTYVGFSVSLSGKDIDFKSPSGLLEAGKLYMSWLSSIFTKFKSITTYAFKINWKDYDENALNKSMSNSSIWNKLK